jgi:antitoxin VapB
MEERRNMPSVLNIKDAEAHALAARLARIEGKSLTEVVKEALREKLDRQRDQRHGLADRLMEIAAECGKLPVIDARSPDEIIGYDEYGVPR